MAKKSSEKSFEKLVFKPVVYCASGSLILAGQLIAASLLLTAWYFHNNNLGREFKVFKYKIVF